MGNVVGVHSTKYGILAFSTALVTLTVPAVAAATHRAQLTCVEWTSMVSDGFKSGYVRGALDSLAMLSTQIENVAQERSQAADAEAAQALSQEAVRRMMSAVDDPKAAIAEIDQICSIPENSKIIVQDALAIFNAELVGLSKSGREAALKSARARAIELAKKRAEPPRSSSR